jgi:hypothetical protein
LAVWITVVFTLNVLAVVFAEAFASAAIVCTCGAGANRRQSSPVALYVFWWAGILLFLALLWDRGLPRPAPAIAAFSLIGPVAVLQVPRQPGADRDLALHGVALGRRGRR